MLQETKVKKHSNIYISDNVSNKQKKFTKLKDLSWFTVFEYENKSQQTNDDKRQQQQCLFIEIKHRNNETLQWYWIRVSSIVKLFVKSEIIQRFRKTILKEFVCYSLNIVCYS